MKDVTKSKLKAREMAIVRELQANHGWMFFELAAERDRRSTIFRRKSNGRGHEMIPARAVKVAFPETSAIADELDASASKPTRNTMTSESSSRRCRRST